MTHMERSKQASKPCTASDQVGEGHCANCGFQPEPPKHKNTILEPKVCNNCSWELDITFGCFCKPRGLLRFVEENNINDN